MRIAFGCQARVGKDTAVKYLMTRYPQSIKISFADPLYDILNYAQKICGFTREKDRKFLQWIGTDWAREKDQEVWLKAVERKINKIPNDTAVFISDLRFPNEFDLCKKLGFRMVLLRRNDRVVKDFAATSEAKHKSELCLIERPPECWDYIIDNNGSLENLYSQLDLF